MELRDGRLSLRRAELSDAPAFAAILVTPEVARWWPAYDLARVECELGDIGVDEAVCAILLRAYEKVASRRVGVLRCYLSCAATCASPTERGRMDSSWSCSLKSSVDRFRKRNRARIEPGLHEAHRTRQTRARSTQSRRDQEGPLPTLLTARFVRAGLTRTATALAAGSLLFGVFAPVAAAADGLEVTTPYPAVSVAPGAKVSFDLTVSSDVAAEVSLKVSGAPTGWTATLHGGGYVVDGVTAGPGKDGTARLDVKVPADAAASTQRLSVEASGAGGAQDVLRISIKVDAAAAGDITITTNTPTLTGSSNGTFPFALTLHNDTAQDVTVSATASVTDHPDWDVKAEIAGQTQAASTVVTAGSTTSINVTADPPDDAPAGQYAVHVEVRAGEQTIPDDFGVDITGSYSFTLKTPGDLLSAHGGAGGATQQQFIITNTGTATLENVAVSATPPAGWDVKFDQPTVNVTVDTPVTVTATITPSGEAVAGDYVVTVSARNDQATQSAQIRFTVETSPVWVVIALGIIGLILVGLFYVFRTYGRR